MQIICAIPDEKRNKALSKVAHDCAKCIDENTAGNLDMFRMSFWEKEIFLKPVSTVTVDDELEEDDYTGATYEICEASLIGICLMWELCKNGTLLAEVKKLIVYEDYGNMTPYRIEVFEAINLLIQKTPHNIELFLVKNFGVDPSGRFKIGGQW